METVPTAADQLGNRMAEFKGRFGDRALRQLKTCLDVLSKAGHQQKAKELFAMVGREVQGNSTLMEIYAEFLPPEVVEVSAD